MRLDTFLRNARRYARLGWALQEQLDSIASGGALEEQNANALGLIEGMLCNLDEVEEAVELAEQIGEYLQSRER